MKKYILPIIISTIMLSCNKDGSVSPATGNTNGIGGSMSRFAISNNTLYIVDNTSMKVFNITNPTSPDSLGVTDLGIGIETVLPYKNNLFIGSQTGMFIYSIDNPLSPLKLSHYEHIFSCDPVVADDQYAYVTLSTSAIGRCGRGLNQLDIVDITDLRNPKFATSKPMYNPQGLGIDQHQLFVCDNGLKVLDVSDKADVFQKRHFTNIQAFDVIPNNGNLIATGSTGIIQYTYTADTVIEISRISF